jgi:hypothetical protein
MVVDGQTVRKQLGDNIFYSCLQTGHVILDSLECMQLKFIVWVNDAVSGNTNHWCSSTVQVHDHKHNYYFKRIKGQLSCYKIIFVQSDMSLGKSEKLLLWKNDATFVDIRNYLTSNCRL